MRRHHLLELIAAMALIAAALVLLAGPSFWSQPRDRVPGKIALCDGKSWLGVGKPVPARAKRIGQ